ncbi:ABC transporter permease [Myroides ceti]|uniref:ABC transporter permease n=1 Tax=Paenimyroides ceti TaxID=395087 RepID=A0ABT8CUC1_9FLAO|nr:ABC transporter permease [Paenimyroides ceti]MDN3707850.1 ABC transporter permease [Paenimyroides ceti]MDN3709503.1 ABC transporter permease [Paenimyroides ceti]
MLYLRLLKESLFFALNALKNNKLRTLLSLLGVTVGIFSIIAVLAAVDSMDKGIRKELDGMDNNMLFVAQFSFGPSEVPRWKIEQFPALKYDEYDFLKRNVAGIDKISFNYFVGSTNIKSESSTANGINITPCSYDYSFIDNVKIDKGRFFNESEDASGAAVIVIGYEVAQTLFPNTDPVGKNVRLYGKRFTVVGVIQKQGASTFGQSKDVVAFIPSNFIRQLYGDNSSGITPAIVIRPLKGFDQNEFKDNVTQKLRAYRGLKPSDIDNFFLNEFAGMTGFIDQIIGSLNIVGWIISAFSLLVGGFGIANIMFVSVKERTNIIGIQKSLGAKNHFILFQFLFEAIILSVIGGLVGLLLVWLIAVVVSQFVSFEFVLSFGNIVIGLILAAIIGLISGILPAISASKLDPVEAIRTGM